MSFSTQNKPQSSGFPGWLLILIIIAGVGYCIYYSYSVISNQVKYKPESTFENNFDGHKVRVSDLQGDKVQTGISDEWIHFKYLGRAPLKHQSEFEKKWAIEGRDWFLEKFPNHPGLTTDLQRLEFYKRTENQHASVINEWLIYNPRTDDHFYRRWGYQ